MKGFSVMNFHESSWPRKPYKTNGKSMILILFWSAAASPPWREPAPGLVKVHSDPTIHMILEQPQFPLFENKTFINKTFINKTFIWGSTHFLPGRASAYKKH